jgi:hypothetical protein
MSVDAPLAIKMRVHATPLSGGDIILVSNYLLQCKRREKRLFHFKPILFIPCTEKLYK